MFDFESNLGSDLGNQPELSVLEQQGSSGGQAHSRIRTVMTMRCVVEGGVHITLGASPKHILLHFPIHLLHFPYKFASFPQQIASVPQQIAAFSQPDSHFPNAILCHFDKNFFWA